VSAAKYDSIGRGYRHYRKPDPRIAAQLRAALGNARSVLNVGAGTGSYEPPDRPVTALEPSRVMIEQRAADGTPLVQGRAESLPFPDGSFGAVLGVLTLHHWSDQAAGLREAVRVARDRVVLLSWVADCTRFWLFDYFPEIEAVDKVQFPALDWVTGAVGARVEATVVPVPADCSDGFLCAYWRRPEAYLDPGVCGAISSLARFPDIDTRLQRLRDDLDSGRWQQRYGELLDKDSMDYGYRVLLLQAEN
jgi:SAM-dependent methyltransferase